jgi:hypothetical protein
MLVFFPSFFLLGAFFIVLAMMAPINDRSYVGFRLKGEGERLGNRWQKQRDNPTTTLSRVKVTEEINSRGGLSAFCEIANSVYVQGCAVYSVGSWVCSYVIA